MKKKQAVLGLMALVILAAAGATSVMAASPNSSLIGKMKARMPINLTETQKTEMKTKMDAVKNALLANDYNAWVIAEKAVDANSPMLTKITATNFVDYATKYQKQEANRTDREAKMAAVKQALNTSDYSAWLAAEKAVDANSPLLTKITSDNFSKYVEANNLREQADAIMKDLGLDNNGGQGFGGPGRGHGEMPFVGER